MSNGLQSRPRRMWKRNPWLLTILFTLIVFTSNIGLDWAFHPRQKPLDLMQVSDVVSALVAGVLFFLILRYRYERHRAIARRLEIIGDMNHHIRNALEVIALSAHTSKDQEQVEAIKQSVQRIQWALKEILPRL